MPQDQPHDQSLRTVRELERIHTWAGRLKPPPGMSTTAYTTLDTLDYAGPLRVSELAVREGITQPGMTGLLNRLDKDGLAARSADPTDGRAALVRITRSGRKMLADHRAERAEFIAMNVDRLQPEDQIALAAALPAIARLMALLSQPPDGSTVSREDSP